MAHFSRAARLWASNDQPARLPHGETGGPIRQDVPNPKRDSL